MYCSCVVCLVAVAGVSIGVEAAAVLAVGSGFVAQKLSVPNLVVFELVEDVAG